MSIPRTTSEDVCSVARKASLEVFRHYGIEEVSTGGALPEDETRFEGIVTFKGPDLRGVCVVAATEQVLSDASPVQLPFDALRDWVGEVANQLAGRIKASLRARGLRFSLSPPLVTMGSLAASRSSHSAASLQVSCRGGGLVAWFEFELLNGECAPSPSGQPPGEAEGFEEFFFFDLDSRAAVPPKRRG